MNTLKQVMEDALDLPSEEQEALAIAIQAHKSEIRRAELVKYARQASLDVRSGKLKPQSVSEIMASLIDPAISINVMPNRRA